MTTCDGRLVRLRIYGNGEIELDRFNWIREKRIACGAAERNRSLVWCVGTRRSDQVRHSCATSALFVVTEKQRLGVEVILGDIPLR